MCWITMYIIMAVWGLKSVMKDFSNGCRESFSIEVRRINKNFCLNKHQKKKTQSFIFIFAYVTLYMFWQVFLNEREFVIIATIVN